MDEAGAHSTPRVADAERGGQLPGVVVPVPDVDAVTRNMLRYRARRVAGDGEVRGRGPARGSAVKGDGGDGGQAVQEHGEQLEFVRLRGGHRGHKPLAARARPLVVERRQMLDGRGDAREVRERRRAGFEAIGDVVRGGRELWRA